MVNEADLYYKYRAYGLLYKYFLKIVEDSSIVRPSVSKYLSLLKEAKALVSNEVVYPKVKDTDTVSEIIGKQVEITALNTYMRYLDEAVSEFTKVLETMGRPTVTTVSKKLKAAVKVVESELLCLP